MILQTIPTGASADPTASWLVADLRLRLQFVQITAAATEYRVFPSSQSIEITDGTRRRPISIFSNNWSCTSTQLGVAAVQSRVLELMANEKTSWKEVLQCRNLCRTARSRYWWWKHITSSAEGRQRAIRVRAVHSRDVRVIHSQLSTAKQWITTRDVSSSEFDCLQGQPPAVTYRLMGRWSDGMVQHLTARRSFC